MLCVARSKSPVLIGCTLSEEQNAEPRMAGEPSRYFLENIYVQVDDFPMSRGLPILSANMFAFRRGAQTSSVLPRLRPRILPPRPYSTSDRTSDRVPTNDPSPPKPVQNVSDSNTVPISTQGLRESDHPLQEMPEDSERQRVMQAPNRQWPWSRSQQPRERAMSGPRFEQTIMEYQVRSIKNRGSLPGLARWC